MKGKITLTCESGSTTLAHQRQSHSQLGVLSKGVHSTSGDNGMPGLGNIDQFRWLDRIEVGTLPTCDVLPNCGFVSKACQTVSAYRISAQEIPGRDPVIGFQPMYTDQMVM